MNRSTLLAAAFALALAACGADNRTSIAILGRAFPSTPAPACAFMPGGQYQLGNDDYDLAVGGSFTLALYVQNNLVDPKTLNPTALTEDNAWNVQAVRVRLNPSDYVGDYRPSPALASITADTVLPVATSPIVEPAGGQATIYLGPPGLLTDGMLTAIQSVTPNGLIVLGVTLQGVTNGGKKLDSGEFFFPLEIVSGVRTACIPPPTTVTCAAGKTFVCRCDGQIDAGLCQ